jgi:hypothetical protein
MTSGPNCVYYIHLLLLLLLLLYTYIFRGTRGCTVG